MSGTITEKFGNIFKQIGETTQSAVNTVKSAITTTASKPNAAPVAAASVAYPTNTSNGLFSVSGVIGLAGYLFSIVAIIFVILLFVHYFITPVIQTRPGAPGYIYLGTDNGVLFWKDGYTPKILNKDTPIASMYYGYTMIIDMKIGSVMPFGTQPRVLFTRGAKASTSTADSAATLSSLFSEYNLAVALKPDTNDLIVSTMSSGKTEENIILNNVPVNTTFRLGIVLLEKSMEVYVNGRLIKTRALSTSLLDAKGDIETSATAQDQTVAKLRNLKIWPQELPTPQIQNARPEMPTDSTMGGMPFLPQMGSSCSPSSSPDTEYPIKRF